MADIKVDRHAIVPAGAPQTLAIEPREGFVLLVIQADGVRVSVALQPGESINLGTSAILCAGAAQSRVPPPKPNLSILNGAG